jgi:O-antigen ligase
MIYLLGGYVWLYVHRPFEVWPALGALQIERIYGLVTILAWLVYPGKGFISNRIHAAMALSTVALVVSWMLSPYANMAGCAEVVENSAKVAVIYVIMVTTVRDEKNLRLLLLFFLGSVGLYASHSLLEWFNGRYQWRMGIHRMIGVDTTYSDPNAFASTLLYSLPLLLPFWLERPRRVPRWLIVGFVLMALFCILKTGSRAGFLGVCLFVVTLIVTSARRKVQAVLFCGVAGLAGLLILAVVLPDELQNRYLTIIDSSRGPANAAESADGRIDGVVLGVHLWQRSPLFGNGPASFVHATGKGLQPHNLYGQVLSELGLAGVAGLAAMVGCFFWNWRESRRLALADPSCDPGNDFTYQVARAVGINVLLLLALGVAGHNLFRYNWQWFAAFSAIALHCLRVRAATAPAWQPLAGEAHGWGYGGSAVSG